MGRHLRSRVRYSLDPRARARAVNRISRQRGARRSCDVRGPCTLLMPAIAGNTHSPSGQRLKLSAGPAFAESRRPCPATQHMLDHEAKGSSKINVVPAEASAELIAVFCQIKTRTSF